jgi:hypothetical protein
MKDCPYYLRCNNVPGADPNGTCSYGCRGSDGPLCMEFGPMTDMEIVEAARRLNAALAGEGT